MSLQWLRRVHGRGEERRRARERRRQHVLFSDWRWAWAGRRRAPRRTGERAEHGVDIYEPRLIAAGLLIFLLSCIDAALTIVLVNHGIAAEANPFMRALLQYDVQTFVNLKIVLTGAGVLFLVVLADALLWQRLPVRRLIQVLLGLYLLVVVIEVGQLLLYA